MNLLSRASANLPYVERQSDRAYATLQKMILEHELPPGSLVNESDLITRLSVGRTPLREAIQRLANDGLVTVLPRRGTIVKGVTSEDARKILEVRIALEMLAVRLAVERATAEDIGAMDEELRKSEVADSNHNVVFDQKMHELYANAAHNSYLMDTLASYYTLSLRWLNFVGFQRETLEDMRAEHGVVVEAIRRKDPETAAVTLRKHIKTRADRL